MNTYVYRNNLKLINDKKKIEFFKDFATVRPHGVYRTPHKNTSELLWLYRMTNAKKTFVTCQNLLWRLQTTTDGAIYLIPKGLCRFKIVLKFVWGPLDPMCPQRVKPSKK